MQFQLEETSIDPDLISNPNCGYKDNQIVLVNVFRNINIKDTGDSRHNLKKSFNNQMQFHPTGACIDLNNALKS